MKNLFILLAAGFSISVAAEPLKLEDAYKAAIIKTEFGAIQEVQKKQYEAKKEKAGAKLLSPVTLKGGYALSQDASGSGYNDSSSLALNITQPLFQGGQLTNALENVRLQEKSNELNLQALKLTLYSSVAGGFYAVLSAEKDKSNVETVIKQTKDMIAELEKRRVIGKAKYSEVLMAQSQLAVLESDLEGVKRTVETSRNDFSFLTGLTAASELAAGEKDGIELKEIDFYLRAAEKRPDILALQADLDSARLDTAFQSAYGLPWLSLTGNYYPYRTGSSSGINWDAGLSLSLKLFDFGDTGAGVKEAKNKEIEAELNLARKKREVETEVRSAFSILKSLKEQVKILEFAVEMNGKNYLEQKKDYDFSLVTNLEVLQAMNSLQNAKKALDRSRLELLLAGAKLLSAGALVPDFSR